MDLVSLKLRLADRHARAVITDARGERGTDLEGDRFERVAKAAEPLIAEIARRASSPARQAKVRAVSIDATHRVLRVSLQGSPLGPGTALGPDVFAALVELVQPVARAALGELRKVAPDDVGTPSEARFWDALYRQGADGWELGRAAPPLARHFRASPPRGLRVLVPGCGRGHEARLLATLGADVVGLDISEAAVTAARALGDPPASHTLLGADRGGAPGALEFRIGDLFAPPEPGDRFDLIVEHTCYCAIEPQRRGEYVRSVADRLVDGGALVGLFFTHRRPGGPPFGTTREELLARFDPAFSVESSAVPHDSIAPRAGEELFVVLRKR